MKRRPTIKELKRRVRQTRIELDYRQAREWNPRCHAKRKHEKFDEANAAHHRALAAFNAANGLNANGSAPLGTPQMAPAPTVPLWWPIQKRRSRG